MSITFFVPALQLNWGEGVHLILRYRDIFQKKMAQLNNYASEAG